MACLESEKRELPTTSWLAWSVGLATTSNEPAELLQRLCHYKSNNDVIDIIIYDNNIVVSVHRKLAYGSFVDRLRTLAQLYLLLDSLSDATNTVRELRTTSLLHR